MSVCRTYHNMLRGQFYLSYQLSCASANFLDIGIEHTYTTNINYGQGFVTIAKYRSFDVYIIVNSSKLPFSYRLQ